MQIQEYSENNNEADNNHKTSMDIYTPIIKQCKSSIGKFEEDVSDIVSYMSSPNEIGYCLRDIDNNGVDELLIVDLRDRKTIIYAYTIVNDTPVEIIYSIERSPYFLSKNNVIINETSSSADEFTINYYNLGSDGKTLELIETLVDYTAHYPEERYYLCSTTQSYYNDYDYSNADEFYIISENDFLNTRNSYAKDYLECTALSDIWGIEYCGKNFEYT